jgi:hypothetical protein
VVEWTRQAQRQRSCERLCLSHGSVSCFPESTAKGMGEIVLGHGINHELERINKTSSESALGEYG